MSAAPAPAAPSAPPQPRVCSSAPYRLRCEPSSGPSAAPLPAASAAPGAPAQRALALGAAYTYCSCGHSMSDPFCDSACQAPALAALHAAHPPISFVADKKQSAYLLCGCKRTLSPPFCDGAHAKLCMADLSW